MLYKYASSCEQSKPTHLAGGGLDLYLRSYLGTNVVITLLNFMLRKTQDPYKQHKTSKLHFSHANITVSTNTILLPGSRISCSTDLPRKGGVIVGQVKQCLVSVTAVLVQESNRVSGRIPSTWGEANFAPDHSVWIPWWKPALGIPPKPQSLSTFPSLPLPLPTLPWFAPS